MTGRLERQKPIHTGLHQHKNLRDRRAATNILMEAVLGILKDGYNPFTDENEFTVDEARKLTIPEATEFVLSIKKHEYTTGFTDFKSRFNMFSDWLLANKFEN